MNAIALLATACAVSLIAAPAWAQDEKGKAAILAMEAEDLLAAGKTSEACPKLQESYKLDPRGGTLLNLAICHEKEGKIGTAFREFDQAEKVAIKEQRNDRAMTARLRKKALFLKVPRLTTKVPDAIQALDGLAVTVGGAELPPSQFGKPFEVDPGEVSVVARTPGKKFEKTVTMKMAQRQTVEVGALVAVAEEPPAEEEPKEEEPKEEEEEEEEEEEQPEPEDEDDDNIHSDDGRLVFDIQFMSGLLIGTTGRAPLVEINGAPYSFPSETGGEFFANCGEGDAFPGAGDCVATFDPRANIPLGGTIFIGYGFNDSFQLGGRAFAAGGVPDTDTFYLAGGPGFSVNVTGRLWLGLNLLFGTHIYTADITGAEGSVPEEYQQFAGGEQVVIPAEDLPGQPEEEIVEPGLMVGGALEISYNLVDWKPADWLAGSLMVSAWPQLMTGGEGVSIGIPIGIGYRFY